MNEHEREEIFRARPDDAKSDSTYCHDNNRVGNRIERARMWAKSFNFASISKNETGSVRQTKSQRHDNDPVYLRSERGCHLRLNQSAEEKFLHKSYFEHKPNETKRQTHKELKGRKVFASKRGAATTEEILEAKENSAYHQHNRQMTAAQRAQTFALNPEIANAITEAESKDRERNGNENNKLLRQADKKSDSCRLDPWMGKMLINPLWASDKIKR
jgi:hypothetical protein